MHAKLHTRLHNGNISWHSVPRAVATFAHMHDPKYSRNCGRGECSKSSTAVPMNSTCALFPMIVRGFFHLSEPVTVFSEQDAQTAIQLHSTMRKQHQPQTVQAAMSVCGCDPSGTHKGSWVCRLREVLRVCILKGSAGGAARYLQLISTFFRTSNKRPANGP